MQRGKVCTDMGRDPSQRGQHSAELPREAAGSPSLQASQSFLRAELRSLLQGAAVQGLDSVTSEVPSSPYSSAIDCDFGTYAHQSFS